MQKYKKCYNNDCRNLQTDYWDCRRGQVSLNQSIYSIRTNWGRALYDEQHISPSPLDQNVMTGWTDGPDGSCEYPNHVNKLPSNEDTDQDAGWQRLPWRVRPPLTGPAATPSTSRGRWPRASGVQMTAHQWGQSLSVLSCGPPARPPPPKTPQNPLCSAV